MGESQQNAWPFIPAALDDYGLAPSAFRVYCHMARRAGSDGVYFESAPRCASHCGFNIKTTRAAIKELLARRLVELTESRPGLTRAYRLTVESKWAEPYPKEYPAQKTGRVSKRVATLPKAIPPYPTQLDTHKGNPSEGHPSKGREIPPAASLQKLRPNSAAFIEASKELDEVKALLKRLDDSYDSHSDMSQCDRLKKAALKDRAMELRTMLGRKY